jgi:phospholipase C
VQLRGRVERKRVARGSKSEHVAVVLRVGRRDYWLRKRGGPSFGDESLAALIGKELRCTGSIAGPQLILDAWEEVPMSSKQGSTGKRSAVSPRARRTNERKARAGAKPGAKASAKLAPPAPPIRHVVLLMLENRSFDQMLGGMQQGIPKIDGVLPPGRANSAGGVLYAQAPGAARTVDPDPKHETPNALAQLAAHNSGFVTDYASAYPGTTQAQRAEIMKYYAAGTLPALHALARAFVVCDRWHASVPGPTWTNRLFAMSGTSRGRVKMPNLHRYQQPSVFRRLAEKGVSYRIYAGDFPLALLLEDQRARSARANLASLSRFVQDARGEEASFPSFAFIEPGYLWPDANDDHPPHDVMRGQALVKKVYDALRANEALWKSTLFVIAYDEHGGFYDHVEPPAAVPPDAHADEYAFDRLGVRVPVLLVSPWLDPQVCSELFDHTSLLRLLQNLWGLGPLGARTAAATDPLSVLPLRGAPRSDAPAVLPGAAVSKALRKKAAPSKAKAVAPPLTDHQTAILELSEWLHAQRQGRKKLPSKAKAAAKTKLGGAVGAPGDQAKRIAEALARARTFVPR